MKSELVPTPSPQLLEMLSRAKTIGEVTTISQAGMGRGRYCRPPAPGSGALGTVVRTARLAKGWRMSHLAEVLGVSRKFLGDVELGRARPDRRVVAELAARLDMDEAALLALAGRLSPAAEAYAREHPKVLELVEAIARAGLDDRQIGGLVEAIGELGGTPPRSE